MNNSQNKADINLLTAAVKDIAIVSYYALSEINAVGKLVQSWMETTEAYRNPEIISRAIDSIVYIAREALESVEGEAESAGCEYMDANTKRRLQAAEEYREGIEN
ncbi:hypothetical protein CE658_26210 [Salmonella enterica]|nr:hypothetical protein [Salmonella enterica]EBT4079878.1 hypothetical protein [Salmonella enterica]EGE4751664.1 hypothetical protein [Salmonella enterica subsp. diarizonae serovar 38:[k]:z35]